MLVLALSKEGQEFIYLPRTARQVSKKSAATICKIVNEYKFLFSCHPGYKWHIHEIDKYDRAYESAMVQKFTIRNGIVKSKAI